MLYLVESFLSIQGEGKYSGAPSIFFRFGGCNFSCRGFKVPYESKKDKKTIFGCDSFYAVDKDNFKKEWIRVYDLNLLIEKTLLFLKDIDYKPNIVITGGEPLLHFKDSIFYGFIEYLLKEGFSIHIETNASIEVDFQKYPLYKSLIYAMSVKLSNSGEDKSKRINKKAIQAISKYSKDSFFKFVIDKDMTCSKGVKNEIEDIVSCSQKGEVFCMSIGKNSEELTLNVPDVINFCIKNGYNYTDRVHIRVYDDKKGV